MSTLDFYSAPPVQPTWAGQLISRGVGRHLRRRMNGYELIFVREGVLGIAEDEREFEVAAGQTLLLWPDRLHYGTQDYGPDLSFYWIHFTLHSAPGAAADDGGVFALPQIATVSRPDYLAELFQRYLDDAASGHQDSLGASLLLQLMLSEVQRSQTSLTGASVPAAQAERFIRTHFHEPLTAGVVSAQVGCSPQYLSRVYRRGYGCTLTEAIQRTRVEYACRLLLASTLRVGEIARACGMEDANYFHQIFKRRKGLTPSAYRRLHAHAEVITE